MASLEPGGYAVTPLPGGRDFHPHQSISCQGSQPCPYPPSDLVSKERVALKCGVFSQSQATFF